MIASFLYFVLAISLLVVIHEFGHFWVARRCGVKVLRFSVGFGKPIWRKKGTDGTEFVLAPIPLGGYVKMLDEREQEQEIAPTEVQYAFNRQSLSKRTAIVLAGPLSNLLFAVLVYWVLFVIGIDGVKPVIGKVEPNSYAMQAGLSAGDEILSVDGHRTPTWQTVQQRLFWLGGENKPSQIDVKTNSGESLKHQLNIPKVKLEQRFQLLTLLGIEPDYPSVPPILSQIVPASPADQAGLKKGDKLLTADGVALGSWEQWVNLIQRSANKTMTIGIERGNSKQSIILTPMKNKDGLGFIGAKVEPLKSLPASMKASFQLSPLDAIPQAIMSTWRTSLLTLKSFWGMLVGSVSIKHLGGPISIAEAAGNAGNAGLISFLAFLAMISITLGILNLLPIPMLDGGHLFLFLIEAIRKKPLSDNIQVTGQQVGLAILLTIMIVAFFNDLSRVFG